MNKSIILPAAEAHALSLGKELIRLISSGNIVRVFAIHDEIILEILK